jgi:two-component system LytT family response regulator
MRVGGRLHERLVEHLRAWLAFAVTQAERRTHQYPLSIPVRQLQCPGGVILRLRDLPLPLRGTVYGGIQIANVVRDDLPAIVFVTAFRQYAVEAFDAQAIDYLLKPFSDQRFFQALDRAKRRVRERRAGTTNDLASATAETLKLPAPAASAKANDFITRLVIGHGDDTLWVDVSDVVWIEAEDYYVRLHTKHGRHLLRASMSSLEERLDPRVFVRSHQAAIVNVGEVSRIDAEGTGLILSDGTQVAISRSRRPVVERVVAGRIGTAAG